MYKLIIVEDEKWEREGLSEYIDWASLGIRFMGAAASGAEGLQLARATAPDIILSDIRMPVMDGLEFAGRVKCLLPECMILFITGYDDFSYAQEAIRQRASDYLLKPVQKDQLVEAILRIELILDAGRQKKESTQRLRLQIQERQRVEREHALERILSGKPLGEGDSAHDKSMFSDHAEFTVVLIRYSDFLQDVSGTDYAREDARQAFCHAVGEWSGEACIVIPGKADGNEIITCMPSFPDLPGEITRLRDRMDSFFQERGPVDFIMGVGGSARNPGDIPRSLLQAEKAADLAFFGTEKGYTVLTYTPDSGEYEEADIQTFITKSSSVAKELLHSVAAASLTNAKESGKQLFLQMEACHLGRAQIHVFLQGIMGELHILSTGILNLPSFVDSLPDMQALPRFARLHSLCEWFVGSIEQLCERITEGKASRDRHLVEHAVRVMHAGYAEGMDLSTVSSRMGISANRLGTLFFQHTGTHFSEALTRFRMKKAEDLLINTEDTLFDIAGKVGFSSASYFCTVFRKFHGISPSEYKRRRLEDAHVHEM